VAVPHGNFSIINEIIVSEKLYSKKSKSLGARQAALVLHWIKVFLRLAATFTSYDRFQQIGLVGAATREMGNSP
jgi:hypothetical protein